MFGERIALIKAMPNNLPIYSLSLFRAPESVVKEMELIQKHFFWEGREIGNRI